MYLLIYLFIIQKTAIRSSHQHHRAQKLTPQGISSAPFRWLPRHTDPHHSRPGAAGVQAPPLWCNCACV